MPGRRCKNNIFSDPTLSEIGAAHGKSVAQVILRWLIQRDVVVIPKSVRPDRMVEEQCPAGIHGGDAGHLVVGELEVEDVDVFAHRDPDMVSWLNSRAD